MTLQFELTEEEGVRLERVAQAQGMNVNEYARLVLGLEVPKTARLSVDEWEASLDELSSDVDPSVPPLSDEALSRQSIYGDRA